MEDRDPLGKILPVLRANVLAATLGILGLLAIGYGFMSSEGSSAPQSEIIIDEDDQESSVLIVVDISGAVEKPGVYDLSSEARVSDVIEAAGGVSEDADSVYIAKNINLAQKVTDGQKLYIPFASEQAQSTEVLGQETGRVSINTANSAALETLPGIGPVTAEKIIKNRPYSSVDDLLSKKSVGPSVFADIKELVSL